MRGPSADHDLGLAARSAERMQNPVAEIGARVVLLDATDEMALAALFDDLP